MPLSPLPADGRCQGALGFVSVGSGRQGETEAQGSMADEAPRALGSPRSIKLFKGMKVKFWITLVQLLFRKGKKKKKKKQIQMK